MSFLQAVQAMTGTCLDMQMAVGACAALMTVQQAAGFNSVTSSVPNAPYSNVQGTSYELTRTPIEGSWALKQQCMSPGTLCS